MIMSYDEFSKRLNDHLLEGDDLYLELLRTVIKNPSRYTGIFRVSSAKTKLIQNLTQSQEIKFGDFMEEIITEYIHRLGYKNLKKLTSTSEGQPLNYDQLFTDSKGNLYMIEQKLRDDHDSTKKRGQFENFLLKAKTLGPLYPEKSAVKSIMWFIDPSLIKNKKYYDEQMKLTKVSRTEMKLYYGEALFSEFFMRKDAWEEITSHLLNNKLSRSTEVLTIPDFDTSEKMLSILKRLNSSEKSKLLSNEKQYIQLRRELFPTGANLKKL